MTPTTHPHVPNAQRRQPASTATAPHRYGIPASKITSSVPGPGTFARRRGHLFTWTADDQTRLARESQVEVGVPTLILQLQPLRVACSGEASAGTVALDDRVEVPVKAHLPGRASPGEVLPVEAVVSVAWRTQNNSAKMQGAPVSDLRPRSVLVDVDETTYMVIARLDPREH